MKIINTLKSNLILAVLGAMLVSCSEEYVTVLNDLLLRNIEMKAGRDEQTQEFRNQSLKNLVIESNQSWCTALIDAETSTITVKAMANDTYEERMATLTLTDMKDASTRSFTVTQAQNEGFFVDKSSTTVPMAGGEVSITVNSNVGVKVDIPADCDWITEGSKAATRGLEETVVVLSVAKNNSGDTRTATVTISSPSADFSQQVRIAQDFEPFLKVDDTPIEIDELGGEMQIKVNANVNFDAYTNAYWIGTSGREQVDEENFIQKITAAKFTEKARSRSTTVTIENVYHFPNQAPTYVRITQVRHLYITESLVTLNKIGMRYGLDIYHSDKTAVKWSSSNEDVVTVDEEGTLSAVGDGEATVTVTSYDGKYSDDVRVIVNVPVDPATLAEVEWSYGYDADTVNAVGFEFINNSDKYVYLESYTFYCADQKVSDHSYNQRAISPKATLEVSPIKIKDNTDYWVEWVFVIDNTRYRLTYDQNKKKTVSPVVTTLSRKR